MSIEFDEEIKFRNTYNQLNEKTSSGLTSWMIKKGIVKGEKDAKLVMIIVIVVCFALSLFFLLK